MTLSPAMQEAMDCIQKHGTLEVWPGGFWTYPGCTARIKGGYFSPDTPFTWATVKALIARGLVRSTRPGYVVEVEPVPQ